LCDVGHDKLLRKIPAWTQVQAERHPSVGVDGGAISSTDVVVHLLLASRNELFSSGTAEIV
jgi:hypothetical protein